MLGVGPEDWSAWRPCRPARLTGCARPPVETLRTHVAMPTLLDAAKGGLTAIRTAKEAAGAVLHPVQWAKEKLIGTLAGLLLEALKATVGPKLAQSTLDRLSLEGKTLPFTLNVTVPAAARTYLEGEGLALAEEIANETLAGPLELLGYRLGTLRAHFDAMTGELRLELQAGLIPTAPLPAAPSAAGTAPLPVHTSSLVP